MNLPSANNQPVAFRSPTSSSTYNERNQEIFHDMITLFEATNELEKELESTHETFEVNNRFQHLHARKLENRIVQLEEELSRLKNGDGVYKHHAFLEHMIPDANAPLSERAYLDTSYEVATLPITGKSISKVYIYDEVTREIYLPSALKVEVLPKTKTGWIIEENHPLEAFNGDNHRYWHRKVSMPLEDVPMHNVSCEMIVNLPETIISNREVNTIYLKTFPVHSLRIDKVEYRLEGDWTLVPGWEGPKEYAGNVKLCFPNVSMSQIRITMTQLSWFEENGKKVYHFGLQEVGVFFTDYQSEMGRVDIPMVLKGDSENKLLTGLKPVFANSGTLNDSTEEKSSLFSYNIYTVDEQGQLHYTKDTFPIMVSHKEIVVKAMIHKDPYNHATPALKAIELTYENV